MDEEVIIEICKHINIQDLIIRKPNNKVDVVYNPYEWISKLTNNEYYIIRDIIFDSVNNELDDIGDYLNSSEYIEDRCFILFKAVKEIVEEYYLESKIEDESKQLFNRCRNYERK